MYDDISSNIPAVVGFCQTRTRSSNQTVSFKFADYDASDDDYDVKGKKSPSIIKAEDLNRESKAQQPLSIEEEELCVLPADCIEAILKETADMIFKLDPKVGDLI